MKKENGHLNMLIGDKYRITVLTDRLRVEFYSKQQFEEWGRKMIFLFQNDDEAQRFNFAEFDKLPNTVVWGTDVEGKIKQEVWQQMKLQSPALPVFLICDSFNRVVFVQQGYTINLGEQLIKVIRQL